MGKILVIKDADFSVNGIQVGDSIDIASSITLNRGYNVNGASTTNNRVANTSLFDLSSYIAQGYTHIIAKSLIPTRDEQCMVIQNADRTLYNQPYRVYTEEQIIIPLSSDMPYLRYSISRTNGNFFNSTYSADALVKLILVKY
jgi:hypothetical protein